MSRSGQGAKKKLGDSAGLHNKSCVATNTISITSFCSYFTASFPRPFMQTQ